MTQKQTKPAQRPEDAFRESIFTQPGRTGLFSRTIFYAYNRWISGWLGRGDGIGLARGLVYLILLGGILYAGTARLVERLNGALVALVIVAFGALLALTVGQVDPARFQVQHWEAVGVAVPVMFVAFVYQNVVPVVTTQLEGDGRRVRGAILLGAVVPFVMFALWNAVILGNTAWGEGSVLGDVVDPIELLRLGAGQRTGYSQLGLVVSVFSEFAIATSFIGFVFGLLDVFEDIFSGLGESVEAFKSYRRLLFYGLVLMPPLALSVIDPNIFFEAIDLAGAYGNSILFGIIPAVMVWQLRYQKGAALTVPSADQSFALVPGGRGLLVTMVGIAVAVIAQNVMLK